MPELQVPDIDKWLHWKHLHLVCDRAVVVWVWDTKSDREKLLFMHGQQTHVLRADREGSTRPGLKRRVRRHAPRRKHEALQGRGLNEVIDKGLHGYLQFSSMDLWILSYLIHPQCCW